MIDEHTPGSRFFTLADVEGGVAADRDALLAALNLRQPTPVAPTAEAVRIELPPSLWPTTPDPVREHLFWWRWKVHEEHDEADVLATGHRLTEAWARHAEDVWAARIYHERHAAREAAREAARKAARKAEAEK